MTAQRLFLGVWLAVVVTGGVLIGNQLNATDAMRNGAIVSIDDFGCSTAWVDVSGTSAPFFPGGEGLVLVNLENTVAVTTPSARLNFHCNGRLPLGEQLEGIDIVTGEAIDAILATHEVACDAIRGIWPNACRGRHGPFISTFETVGVECNASDGDVTIFTRDWIAITTVSGQSSINCHFKDAPYP